jgi:enoyl-CoA hydratase
VRLKKPTSRPTPCTSEVGMDEVRVDLTGHIATVTIDRPPVNALTIDMYRQVARVFTELAARPELRCAILTAAGTRAFSAGLDVHEFLAMPIEADEERQRIGLAAFTAISNCPVPLIGAINGVALGAGMVFASLCDTRIASASARFGLPEINVGRCGGASHLARLVPQGLVRRMFFTGEPIDAVTALRAGLVEEVVEPLELEEAARSLARRIASKSPLGLRLGKQALNAAEFLPVDEGYRVEQSYSAQLVQTHDSREALRAVVEKREPRFEGR